MSDDFLFTCSECGHSFEPDPHAILECGWDRCCVPEEEQTEAIFEEGGITEDALKEMSEYQLAEIGMTLAQRDQLLSGAESIDAGTICLCKGCREALFNESADSEAYS